MIEFPPKVVWPYGSVWPCGAVSTPRLSGRVEPIIHIESCGCVSIVGPSGHVGSVGHVGPVDRVGSVVRVGPG